MSLVAQPKPIFRGIVVATTGNVGQGRKGWSEADIQRYLESWGGRFSPDLDASVTHLIATPDELQPKKRSAQVNSALKRKNLTILSLDWLEDSFIETRKLPPQNYLLAKGGRSIAESTQAKRLREQKKAAKEDEIGKIYVHPRLFKAYFDETFFKYEIVLTREQGDRYTLTLFESHAEPHMYHFGWIYHRSKGAKAVLNRMKGPEAGVTFDAAFKEFADFFKRQSGVDWDDRVSAFHKGKEKVTGHGFVYELPSGGKPIGLINGKVPDMDAIFPSSDNSTSHPEEEAKAEAEAEDKAVREESAAHDGASATTSLPIIARSNDASPDDHDADDSGVDDIDDPGNTTVVNHGGLVDEGYESI
ncbi:indole-3-glycerol phosphate synthase-domain-containing protein [Apiospora rasikravindrae]|uniref:Indole-3-glycerol phosphate synthase-domain-containing protein n=1 Tax=Apiospora rasikravindrae TaxID=990691 RepID=A0ABR1SKJ7_9PEZI